jgi:hypothetical protein
MTSCVKVCSSNLLDWHTIPAIVAWMRKVPSSANHQTFSIRVGPVVADWSHTDLSTCLVNVICCDKPTDSGPLEIVISPCERQLLGSRFHAYRLAILIMVP